MKKERGVDDKAGRRTPRIRGCVWMVKEGLNKRKRKEKEKRRENKNRFL